MLGKRIALPAAMLETVSQNEETGVQRARTMAGNILVIFILAFCAAPAGCSGTTVPVSSADSAPSPSAVSITLSPKAVSVLLGEAANITASVSGAADSAVTWSVAGIPGGNTTVGTISASGDFIALQFLPVPSSVMVQAISVADGTKKASSVVTIASDVAVAVSPPAATVELGAQQALRASVTSQGAPNNGVTWSVSGNGCAGSLCGTITPSGVFTAPQILPPSPAITLTATSLADPSRSASAAITIASHFTFSLSGPSAINAGAAANFIATLTPLPDSNPAAAISWTASGAGCAGLACGPIVPTGSGGTAIYTAPAAAPVPDQVTITAIPLADPSKAAATTVTIVATDGAIQITVAPGAATLAIAHRQTFTAQISNSSSPNAMWEVNGISGGNNVVGQICAVNSNPCQPVASSAPSVDYLAPAAVPSPYPVQLQAISVSDPTRSAAATITILAHTVVSISPPSVTLVPGQQQAFAADVLETTNQQVTWNVSGAACAAAGNPCGTIDATGLYTAPATVPSPNSFAVMATSSEDTSRTATAAVTITLQPAILSLSPSSAVAGAAGGFTLLVEDGNFAASSPGPGSALLIGGSVRNTVCASSASCTTSLTAQDLAIAENLSVAVQNPNGATSNPVSFVVVPQTSNGPRIIPLTPSAPSAAGENISVVELSTNGSSSPSQDAGLNVVAVGPYVPATGSCTLGGGPVTLIRPSSGTATADICAFSVSGLDPSLAYTLTGPSPADITIVAKAPLGLGIVDLALQIPSSALAGPRTLFIQNSNVDVTAATGGIEVQ